MAVYLTSFAHGAIVVSEQKEKDLDAKISYKIESRTVDRVEVLETFLTRYDSPLKGNAPKFVEVADKYGMDYRLLVAISCLESTCGKKIIPESYNAWGWGIYGNNVITFENFDQAIEEVGKGIYEGYAKKGLDTPAKMAPIYTPPRPGHWLSGVNYFLSQMDEVATDLQTS